MTSAEVHNLNRLLEAERPAPQPLSLHDRFLKWYRSNAGFHPQPPFLDVRVRGGAQDPRQIHQSRASGVWMATQTDMEHGRALSSVLGASPALTVKNVKHNVPNRNAPRRRPHANVSHHWKNGWPGCWRSPPSTCGARGLVVLASNFVAWPLRGNCYPSDLGRALR